MTHPETEADIRWAVGNAKRLERENVRLRAALKAIADEQNYSRYTVTPETAFEDFGKLNAKVCAIYDVARNALNPAHQQQPAAK